MAPPTLYEDYLVVLDLEVHGHEEVLSAARLAAVYTAETRLRTALRAGGVARLTAQGIPAAWAARECASWGLDPGAPDTSHDQLS